MAGRTRTKRRSTLLSRTWLREPKGNARGMPTFAFSVKPTEILPLDRAVPRAFCPEEQKPSAQPRKRLNSQETQKITGIVSAPPQVPQVAADATIRYNRSWYLENPLDIDEPAIAYRDLVGGVEETDMSRVVEIGD